MIVMLFLPTCFGNTDLSKLVDKQIYRDVPAKNKTNYDAAYQNIPYTINSYSENIVSLRDSNGKLIVLERDLWDDGNWKEYKDAVVVLEKLHKVFSGKKLERLSVRELVGSETAGFKLSDWASSYCCVKCGQSLTTVYNSNTAWYCFKCKKYFNIEKGK